MVVMADVQALSVQEMLQDFDWGKIKEKVQDYAPVFSVLRNTWSRETLLEIAEGKVFVPDETLNDLIAGSIKEGSSIRSVKLTSTEKGRLEILADTARLGRIELSGTIEELVHKGDRSYVVYKVRERSLPDHGLGSWLFSRISLSMVQKVMGRLQFSEDVPTEIKGNTITVDLTKALADTELARTEYRGYRLLDMIEIEGAKPKAGGIELDTALNVPDEVKKSLLDILKL